MRVPFWSWLRDFRVIRPHDLGDTTPLHNEAGQIVEITKIPISEVTGVSQAAARWSAQFHRPDWRERSHHDQLPWYLK